MPTDSASLPRRPDEGRSADLSRKGNAGGGVEDEEKRVVLPGSGPRLLGLALVGVLCLLGASLGHPSEARATPGAESPATLAGLLEAFRGMPGLEARFFEEKHIALLAAPLRSEGKLFFAPPGTLLRRVESPRPAEVLITQNSVRLRQDGSEERIDLRARRELQPLVESMLWIFSGDRAALERAFRVEYARTEEGRGFSLSLTPREAPLNQLIRRLHVEGEGFAVRRVEVLETSGDRTVTTITHADPGRRFSSAERQRLFGTR